MPRLCCFLFIVFLGVIPVSGQQNTMTSDAAPYPCPNSNGAYFQAGVFPRFDPSTGQLDLIAADGATKVRHLDTIDQNVRIINWSPDCHYLTGAVGKISGFHATEYLPHGEDYISWDQHSVVIWDTVNGGRLQAVDNPGDYLSDPAVIWSPDSRYALLRGGCFPVHFNCTHERDTGNWLWQSDHNSSLSVAGWFNQYTWDFAHNRIWGSSWGRVLAYDLSTGESVADFKVAGYLEGRFAFSPDQTKIIIYGTPVEFGSGRMNIPITVYDIATRTAAEINPEAFGFPQIPYNAAQLIALSPDNRYLVVGYDALRVWDLQNLLANFEDRLPIYRYSGPKSVIQSLRFVASDVIETTSDDGTQKWNLLTGAYIP